MVVCEEVGLWDDCVVEGWKDLRKKFGEGESAKTENLLEELCLKVEELWKVKKDTETDDVASKRNTPAGSFSE